MWKSDSHAYSPTADNQLTVIPNDHIFFHLNQKIARSLKKIAQREKQFNACAS